MAKAITESKKKQKKSKNLSFKDGFSYSGKEMDDHFKAKKSSNIQTRMSPSGYEMAKGGRAGYKGGKSVKKKRGAAIRGRSKITR